MLRKEFADLIQDDVALSIADRKLTNSMLNLVYDNKWFNLWVPKDYGGLGAGLAEGCALLEELAYVDGGFGWTVTLCAGANMFAGFLDPKLAESIFSRRTVCWGGSGKPSGRADVLADGYLLSGSWMYATGAPHLSHFTVNAWIYEEGKQVCDAAGNPVYRSFFIDRDDVLIHYDWNTFGLACTASHSFSVAKVFLPENRAFDLIPESRQHEAPLYYYPFMTFAACTLAVNYSGMFRRFLDVLERCLFVKAAEPSWDASMGKEKFKKVDRSRSNQADLSSQLYGLIDATWGQPHPDERLLDEISLCSRQMVQQIKQDTAALFSYAGITGAQQDSELNIVFRHLFTAAQHSLLNSEI
ncbi:acyl-CoA dehydrogenase family protein [Sphingobacterium griseoflavum]|uniref:Hydroxylase n=1 Tax=Sphingobacterium griseoflavum TaxID=1474952 RepID=A0ABQ3HXG0_9SPHI|nr:acyl-CoA dehydrogenase family protein [Sphingobacterium griseoflavum]GHE34069.1 hydroxylase [Sphingobacterium griseoflavum]